MSSDLVRGLKDAAAWFRMNGDPEGAARLMEELAALDPAAARELSLRGGSREEPIPASALERSSEGEEEPIPASALERQEPIPASSLIAVRTEAAPRIEINGGSATPEELAVPYVVPPESSSTTGNDLKLSFGSPLKDDDAAMALAAASLEQFDRREEGPAPEAEAPSLQEAERLAFQSNRGRTVGVIVLALCLPAVVAWAVHALRSQSSGTPVSTSSAPVVAAAPAVPAPAASADDDPVIPLVHPEDKVGLQPASAAKAEVTPAVSDPTPQAPQNPATQREAPPTVASPSPEVEAQAEPVATTIRWLLTSAPSGAEVVRLDTGAKLGRTPLELDVERASKPVPLRFTLASQKPITVSASRTADSTVAVAFVSKKATAKPAKKKASPGGAKQSPTHRDDLLDPYAN